MKICRNINYDDFGINEETGWKVSYDWIKLRKKLNKIFIAGMIFTVVLSRTVLSDLNVYGRINGLLCAGTALLIFLFVLTPIHEILHIIAMVGFKFNDKCYIIIGKGVVSAFYGGEITKRQHCVSLITPLLVLGLIIAINIVFLSGIFKYCAIIVLLSHIFGCYTDIYMFFYLAKNFPENTIFFGNRYRIV